MGWEAMDVAEITYLGHSGFTVRTDAHFLAFDCLRDPGFAPEKGAGLCFVSHAHRDHFWPPLAALCRAGGARMIAGEGVAAGGATTLKPGEEAEIALARIRAFGSTDEGVSFWVEADALRVFHAGDLNFWHWREESTAFEVERARADFEDVLKTLRGLRVDLAFFPVDPRLGAGMAEGAVRFAEEIRPALIIPMHFWDDARAAVAFAQGPLPPGVRAAALTRVGERLTF